MKTLLFLICMPVLFFETIFSVLSKELEANNPNCSITIQSGGNTLTLSLDQKTIEPYLKLFCEKLGSDYALTANTLQFNNFTFTQEDLETIDTLFRHMHQQINNHLNRPIILHYEEKYIKNRNLFLALVKVFQHKNPELTVKLLHEWKVEVKEHGNIIIAVTAITVFLLFLADTFFPNLNNSQEPTTLIIKGDVVGVCLFGLYRWRYKSAANYNFLESLEKKLNIGPLNALEL